jgi:hypothetical protein
MDVSFHLVVIRSGYFYQACYGNDEREWQIKLPAPVGSEEGRPAITNGKIMSGGAKLEERTATGTGKAENSSNFYLTKSMKRYQKEISSKADGTLESASLALQTGIPELLTNELARPGYHEGLPPGLLPLYEFDVAFRYPEHLR